MFFFYLLGLQEGWWNIRNHSLFSPHNGQLHRFEMLMPMTKWDIWQDSMITHRIAMKL